MLARIIIAVAFLIASTGLGAQAGNKWTLRVYGALVDSSSESSVGVGGVSSSVDVGGGLGVGGEYRMSNRLGLELSTLWAGLDIESDVSVGGVNQNLQFGMVPLTLGLTIHLNPRGRPVIFIAPTLSYVSYYQIETNIGWTNVSATENISSDMAPGATLGLDIPIGKGKWAVSTGLRYMNTDADDTSVDPLIVTLGFGVRF